MHITETAPERAPDASGPGGSPAQGHSPVWLAQRLIRFNTVNPPGDEAECVQWIRGVLDGAGIETRIVARDPRRPNLIARLPGRGLEPPLLLHAHVDVVPVEGQKWTRSPFAGEIVDGELWGRGAVDMKGQLAMMMAALLRMKARGEVPAGDVILAVVPDEETGSDVGARFLVERHPELFNGVRYAIGEDGGAELGVGRHARIHPVVVAEKRTCWVRLTLRGPGGHASRVAPDDGAVNRLRRVLESLSSGGLGIQQTPVVDRMLKELANALPPGLGERIDAFRSDPTDPGVLDGLEETTARYLRSLVQHTVSATVLHGGTGTNVHPTEITLELDGRVLPGGFTTEDFLTLLRQQVGTDLDMELFVEGETSPPPRLDAFYDRLAAVLRSKDPEGIPLPMVTTASTDARLFSSRLGIQCFGWMPLRHDPDVVYRDLLHCPDERLAVSALEFGADCFHSLLSGTH
ncbi:M20/M25/M40 family metallo-hydrolase [Streptomyces sp. NPDC054786]